MTMTAMTKTMNTDHLLNAYEEAGAFFPVHQENINTESGIRIPKRKANMRSDTGAILGIVSDGYRVVDYREGVVLPALRALEDSGLDLTDSSVRVDFAKNGGRMLSVISLPAHEIVLETPKGEDRSQLQMMIRSGHDAEYMVDVAPGAIRMACLNGMYDMTAIGIFKGKHTSGFNVGHLEAQVGGLLRSFESQAGNWQRWAKTPITDAHAWHAIQMYTWTKKESLNRGLEVYTERGRVTKAVKLMDVFNQRDKPTIGATAWGVYNTLTSDATHSERPEGKEATSSDLRHGNVRRVVTSDFWNNQLLAA